LLHASFTVLKKEKILEFGRFEAKLGIAAFLLAILFNASSCYAFLCKKLA
jgi:hypothetical protein